MRELVSVNVGEDFCVAMVVCVEATMRVDLVFVERAEGFVLQSQAKNVSRCRVHKATTTRQPASR